MCKMLVNGLLGKKQDIIWVAKKEKYLTNSGGPSLSSAMLIVVHSCLEMAEPKTQWSVTFTMHMHDCANQCRHLYFFYCMVY